jgi:replicative DNA helicase
MGEYTRGLIALGKELDAVVILLAQLNRECEKRADKRPIMSDLGVSGYIEQDAANIIFLYRDELWNPETARTKASASGSARSSAKASPASLA